MGQGLLLETRFNAGKAITKFVQKNTKQLNRLGKRTNHVHGYPLYPAGTAEQHQ